MANNVIQSRNRTYLWRLRVFILPNLPRPSSQISSCRPIRASCRPIRTLPLPQSRVDIWWCTFLFFVWSINERRMFDYLPDRAATPRVQIKRWIGSWELVPDPNFLSHGAWMIAFWSREFWILVTCTPTVQGGWVCGLQARCVKWAIGKRSDR